MSSRRRASQPQKLKTMRPEEARHAIGELYRAIPQGSRTSKHADLFQQLVYHVTGEEDPPTKEPSLEERQTVALEKICECLRQIYIHGIATQDYE